jgi:hypothetical protein
LSVSNEREQPSKLEVDFWEVTGRNLEWSRSVASGLLPVTRRLPSVAVAQGRKERGSCILVEVGMGVDSVRG